MPMVEESDWHRLIAGRTFPADCPHCHTKRVAFTIHNGVQWKHVEAQQYFDLFAVCSYCYRGVVATFSEKLGESLLNRVHSAPPEEMFPSGALPSAPPYTPESVARYVIQGKDLQRQENGLRNGWDGSVLMFRKALEMTLEEKFPEIKGNLSQRIRQAAEQGALTPELAEWSHRIRDEGNKAAHEKGPYQEKEAKELAAFTDMLLRYLFTLPGMMEKKRREFQPSEAKRPK